MRRGIEPFETLKVFGEKEISEVHRNTLRIMEQVGLRVRSKDILEFLGDNGCEVDFDEQMVYVPSYLVEECIDSDPSSFRLGARDSENDVMFQQGRSYFCSCSGPINVLDQEEGINESTKKDLDDSVRLSDALKNIDIVWPQFSLPNDPLLGLHEMDSALSNSTKHIGLLNWYGRNLVGKQIDILREVAGGEQELRERPLATLYVEPTSPLSMAEEHAEAILEWTDHDLPYINFPIQFTGSTSPVTLAGSVSQALAESFLGLVIGQLNNPGNPFIGGVWPFPMDLKEGKSPYFAAEALLIQSISGQMADFYGIPVFGTGGCTNSYFPDAQMGTEMAMTLMGAFYGGETLIHDIGYTGAGDASSMENMVFANEIIEIFKKQSKGVDVNEDTLAFDLVKKIGPGGDFVSTEHTQNNLDKIFSPEFLKREKMDFLRDKSKKAMKKVRKKMKSILEEHEPKPLSSSTQEKIDQVIKESSEFL
ncbi:MAG: Trimethylamine:corrinoid methyltransferase, MttB2 [Candidatus Methanohalarchaeum thermophilum]|uniref:Trimethylamine:corrinoid methyltransferase, MttB2 n=1 Tax=Methanohalarchaeum thermophilum TaxID=1903181 RepID=A0A1Q6DVM7_METT1|nr:MAG: Trimethylamine:corrinoid methyltransferase, MttB2 [Candidatus Methanohalarchaeum thermophilum]